ncbi:MAG: sulfatase-like hydrolase/transferase [Acidimicrobiia bacterium]|nr:sulfatase-like hydrolase/transferase [Acidimicrobiia bacterium]
MSPRAPNILLVMADQHRADVMGCAGDPSVHTPNLDRLAAEGVRFSRTSCQGPLCMPARASFLTERYVRDHGVYTNWAEVAPGTPTYLHALRDAGYRTAMIGKAHLTRDDVGDPRHVDALAPRLEERGFAEVQETGDKFSIDPPNRYVDHLRDRGLLGAYARHIADRSYHGTQESGRGATKQVPMWDATPSPLPLGDYIDTWHGDLAVRWLEQYDGDVPFFAFVGFPGPHDPWDAPRAAVDAYAPSDVTMPRSTRRPDLEGTDGYGRLLGAFLGLSDTDTMSDTAIQGMRRAYAANVSIIDDALGRLLGVLDARGMLDNTWVLYTSDHGEMGGNHGLMSKCVLYEQSVRVPLLVRPPGGCEARVVDDLVEHLDVPATVRAIASAPPVPQSEGRSLLGYVHGNDPEARTVSVSENWGFAAFSTERYKLVVDEDALSPCQLFDLREDPDEDENRVADPECADAVEELMATTVRPFFATAAARPHPSPFAG